MAIALVTGSSGLIGHEACRFFHEQGFDIVGIDNGLRKYFLGADGSNEWKTSELKRSLPRFTPYAIDIRNEAGIGKLFAQYGNEIKVIIHTAAQPSHEWAQQDPLMDFSVNAVGTLVLLQSMRTYCPEATFILTSTNKVYGDTPNRLPLIEKETRYELDESHPYAKHGVDESMSLDQSKHSLYGVSKLSGDLLTQEFGRYFGLKTGVFRGGCLTGPGHSGAKLHGFLAYLVKCAVTETPYTIFGYGGKQVRDNIHSYDLVNAFWHFFQTPKPGAVYNMGGSRHSNTSVLEAIALIEKLTGKSIAYTVSDEVRAGDHQWWISDVRRFQKDFPQWKYRYQLEQTLSEMIESAHAQKRAA